MATGTKTADEQACIDAYVSKIEASMVSSIASPLGAIDDILNPQTTEYKKLLKGLNTPENLEKTDLTFFESISVWWTKLFDQEAGEKKESRLRAEKVGELIYEAVHSDDAITQSLRKVATSQANKTGNRVVDVTEKDVQAVKNGFKMDVVKVASNNIVNPPQQDKPQQEIERAARIAKLHETQNDTNKPVIGSATAKATGKEHVAEQPRSK